MSFNRKYLKFGKICHISQEAKIPVLPNLAITPSKMAQLVDAGIPVSSAVLSAGADDGVNSPSWDLPVDQRRGIDVAQVWEAQRDARSKITNRVSLKSDSHVK